MKKIQFLAWTFLMFLILSHDISCKNVAILIMDGKFENILSLPNISNSSSYWVKLIEIYERLIEHGYTHNNIYVFYGDGYDGDLYIDDVPQLPSQYLINLNPGGRHEGWDNIEGWNENNNITDFPVQSGNYIYNTIRDYIKDNISSNDNLLIIWHSHGGSLMGDDLWASHGTSGLTENGVYNAFKQINNYQRRIIVWETCYSGALIKGDKTFFSVEGNPYYPDDAKTIVLTASDSDEEGCLYIDNLDIWEGNNNYKKITQGGLVYGLICALNGKDFYGIDYTIRGGQTQSHYYSEQGPVVNGVRAKVDANNDGVISFSELYTALDGNMNEGDEDHDEYYDAYYQMTWGNCGNTPETHPQIAISCTGIEDFLYFDEYLIMDGDNIRNEQIYWNDYYRAGSIELRNNIEFGEDVDINLVADEKIIFKPGFHAVEGSKVHARIGTVSCGSTNY